MGRAQICDEQRGLGINRELPQSLHHARAGEKGRGTRIVGAGVPVKKTMLRLVCAEFLKKSGDGGDKRRIGRFAIHGITQAGADGFVDLLGEIEILARERGKKRVEKVEATQLGRARHFLDLGVSGGSPGSRLLISSTNSDTSRNSL